MDPTRDLTDHMAGDPSKADRLMQLIYDKLRGVARKRFSQERSDHTLEPTALVHEIYLRLIDDARVDQRTRNEFFSMAARTLRQVLVDHARSHGAQKRGGHLKRVTLNAELIQRASLPVDVLSLEEALLKLGEKSERQGKVVELRFFAGLTEKETADILGVSERTVRGDWELARAWLAREMDGESKKSSEST